MKWFFQTIGLAFLLQLMMLGTFAQSKVSIGFQLTSGYSSIKPSFPAELSGSTSKQNYVFDGGFNGRYYFNYFVGIEAGVMLLSYKSIFSGDAYNVSFTTADSENEKYVRTVSGTGISESVILRSINIPIHLIIRSYISKKMTAFGSFGPEFSTSIQKQSHGTGTFTYKGYYPRLGASFDTLLAYGFYPNVPVDVKRNLDVSLINISVGAGVGLNYEIDKQYELFASVNYRMPLSKIVSTGGGNYYISNELGSFYSILDHGKAQFSNISFSIGIQMNLRWIPKY